MLRFFILVILTAALVAGAPASIGTVTAHGSIQVDGSPVFGNATVFDGTLIETGKATTNFHLQRGIELAMAPSSRGKLFSNKLVLEKGTTELSKASGFLVEASSLRIQPLDNLSKGAVSVQGTSKVSVSASAGEMNVSLPNGLLLAKVTPERALEFDSQNAGATAPTTITGRLSKVNGHYFVTVLDTGMKYEVTGQNFDNMIGKTVTVTGTPDPNEKPRDGAVAVLTVTNASIAGGAATAAGVSTGMALGTKLIITGVVVAAGVGTGVGLYEANKSSASQ
ncbi:MAG TPA: hypothetical protein VKU01_22030 [Bryobacteraceae bacterium]|nr:hypothetical protein [Bryobacteraceae bacterium]